MHNFRPRLPYWFEEYCDDVRSSKDINQFLSKLGRRPVSDDNDHCNVLVFDIETAPLSGYVWSLWKQNIYGSQIKSDWFMLTWSAKWLFEDKVMSARITPEELAEENDLRITKLIWDLLEEADIVIAHNGNKFDLKSLNTRFLYHKLPNPSPYESIDTLKHARKAFRMSSNRLDAIARYLDIGTKIDTGGFDLWRRCMERDEDALIEMERYNIRDVKLLEDIYLRMRAWIKPHPNMYLYIGDNVSRCPTCGSDDIKYVGEYHTYTNTYDAFRCQNCGSLGRSRSTNTKLTDHRAMKTSIPK